jgi:hypothetical protein
MSAPPKRLSGAIAGHSLVSAGGDALRTCIMVMR